MAFGHILLTDLHVCFLYISLLFQKRANEEDPGVQTQVPRLQVFISHLVGGRVGLLDVWWSVSRAGSGAKESSKIVQLRSQL